MVHELPELEPATVLGMLSWDPLDAGQYHRAFDILLGQFGDPAIKNAQYSILPFNIPGMCTASRFRGALSPIRFIGSRDAFRSRRKRRVDVPASIAEHAFTSGIPTPGGERIHINLFAYGNSQVPQKNGVEVIIEKFVYLP